RHRDPHFYIGFEWKVEKPDLQLGLLWPFLSSQLQNFLRATLGGHCFSSVCVHLSNKRLKWN
ncbi:hypothetical protein LEMLEM_LOCUS19706, partial [Lemmus lemmus]